MAQTQSSNAYESMRHQNYDNQEIQQQMSNTIFAISQKSKNYAKKSNKTQNNNDQTAQFASQINKLSSTLKQQNFVLLRLGQQLNDKKTLKNTINSNHNPNQQKIRKTKKSKQKRSFIGQNQPIQLNDQQIKIIPYSRENDNIVEKLDELRKLRDESIMRNRTPISNRRSPRYFNNYQSTDIQEQSMHHQFYSKTNKQAILNEEQSNSYIDNDWKYQEQQIQKFSKTPIIGGQSVRESFQAYHNQDNGLNSSGYGLLSQSNNQRYQTASVAPTGNQMDNNHIKLQKSNNKILAMGSSTQNLNLKNSLNILETGDFKLSEFRKDNRQLTALLNVINPKLILNSSSSAKKQNIQVKYDQRKSSLNPFPTKIQAEEMIMPYTQNLNSETKSPQQQLGIRIRKSSKISEKKRSILRQSMKEKKYQPYFDGLAGVDLYHRFQQ
eukprot:403353712